MFKKNKCPDDAICAYEYKGNLFKTKGEREDFIKKEQIQKQKENFREIVMIALNKSHSRVSFVYEENRYFVNTIADTLYECRHALFEELVRYK